MILSAENIVKSYHGQEILKGVSLQMAQGDVVAVIGRSGSGKSTLLRCLSELERVDQGRIVIGGETMVENGRYESEKKLRAIRRRMGYVFQDFNLFPHMSVLRNVTEAQRCVLGRGRTEAETRAKQLLADMGLADKGDAYPCFLSGGQQQRAAIARALALDPDILCFDEPTSALDPLLTQEVLAVIRRLAQQGHTMIVVTHEMSFAREVADRILYMENGRIACEGDPETVFADARVSAFAGG